VHPGYGELRVRVEDRVLSFRVGETDVSARHRQLDTWDLHYDALDLDVACTFGTDADGAVSQVTLPYDGEQPVIYRRAATAE
jgi:hypothetical protein